MIRIAYVVPYLTSPSGWRSMAKGVITAMLPHVDPVLIVRQADAQIARDMFPGKPVVVLPETQAIQRSSIRRWPTWWATWRAIQQLPNLQVDLVHALDAYPTGWVAQQIARKNHIPYLISPVGTYAVIWYQFLIDRLAYNDVLKGAAYLCPISSGTLVRMQKHFGASMKAIPTEVTLLGSDFAKQTPAPNPSAQPDSSPDPLIIGVGQVKERKGYHISLEAFRLLQKRLPQARYWIIGNDDDRAYVAKLKQQITDGQISNVEILGGVSTERLQSAFREAQVFMLTPRENESSFEGFGLVFLEAGAYGLPVVSVSTGGVLDAVKNGETGLVSTPDDPQAISEALYRLLTDSALRARMGTANRVWSETLTWERFAAQQLGIYQKVLLSKSPSIG